MARINAKAQVHNHSTIKACNHLHSYNQHLRWYGYVPGKLHAVQRQSFAGGAGLTIVGYLYRLGWEQANIGYGSAIGLTLLVITLGVNVIMLKYAGLFKKENNMKAKRSIKLTPQTGIMLMLFIVMAVITLTPFVSIFWHRFGRERRS